MKIFRNKDLENLASGRYVELIIDPVENVWPSTRELVKGKLVKLEDFPEEEGRFEFIYSVGEKTYNFKEGKFQFSKIDSILVRSLENMNYKLSEEGQEFVDEWCNFIYKKNGEIFLREKFRSRYYNIDILNAGKGYKRLSELLDSDTVLDK